MHIFSRTELLLGQGALERLARARMIVFGIGGVGGYASEALVRCGLGNIALVDHDTVGLTNINRQVHATHSTLGLPKVDAMASRLLDINPDAVVETIQLFFAPGMASDFLTGHFDCVLDCMDTVACKLALVVEAHLRGFPTISCMGTGNKLDPTGFRVADIYETTNCPLARTMRKELRKRGIDRLRVVYSGEAPRAPLDASLHSKMLAELSPEASSRRAVPGSVPFVPAAAGLLMAAEAVGIALADGGQS